MSPAYGEAVNLRHLEYFLAVAEELHIGRAAVRIGISQPPLTRQMRQLEEELGVDLLVRTPRGVELTEAGATLVAEARNIVSLVQLAAEHTRRAGEGKLGRLDIGIFGSAILDTIPKLLELFREDHPDVTVVLHAMNKLEQLEALRQKRIRIGFNRMLEPQPDIESRIIIMEPLFVALNETHPLAERERVNLADLSEDSWVAFPIGKRPSFVDLVMNLCRAESYVPDIVQLVGDATTGLALVGAGFGVTMVPKSSTTMKVPGVVYRKIDSVEPAVVDLSCAYRADDDSAILREFLMAVTRFQEGGAQVRADA